MPRRKQQQLKMSLMMSQAQGVIVKENGYYKSHISYKPGKLMVNGKDMSALLEFLKMQRTNTIQAPSVSDDQTMP